MKRLKLVPLTFILIIVIFTAIMAYVRLDNSHQLYTMAKILRC